MNINNQSIRALTFLATRTFEKYCQHNAVEHESISRFCEHMKHLAIAEDIPDWDNEANQLAITGLGDPIPSEISDNHFVNEVTCHIREISASSIYGKYLPEQAHRFFKQVVESCDLAIDEASIICILSHSNRPDGWGRAISKTEYAEWENAL